MKKTKIYALYLPQYYETDYNNEWWGKGYTEWTACKQAKPLLKNQYQPRLPYSHYFYDLSKEENEALFHKRLDLYINKYYSLISSLFNDNYYIIEKGNSKISTDDLINYLSIYNLDGNYEIFRSKNKNTLIGNNEINKVDYQNKIEFLNGIVNTLIEKCANRINNKYIDIIDLRSDKEELINLRNIKIGEIDVLIEGEKLNARR